MTDDGQLFLYPRLPLNRAAELVAELGGRTLRELRSIAATEDRAADYYATGVRVSHDHLERLASVVRDNVDSLGFPDQCRGPAQRQFDQTMPTLLHSEMRIVPADAASEGVWSFLTLVLLPDVAFWRFPQAPDYRLIGRPRNVLRRYWWRAQILGGNEEGLPAKLGEDQHVQIEERRAAIGGNPPLARTLARQALNRSAANPDVGIEPLVRDAAKRVVRLTPFMCFEALPERELEAQIGELVDAAVRALRRR